MHIYHHMRAQTKKDKNIVTLGSVHKRGKGNYQEQLRKNSRLVTMHQVWEETNPD